MNTDKENATREQLIAVVEQILILIAANGSINTFAFKLGLSTATKEQLIVLIEQELLYTVNNIPKIDLWAKAIVGSIFDTLEIDEVIEELTAWNEGFRPTYFCQVQE